MRVGAAADLVIFDCDGVLVDSEILSARVLAEELTAIGFAMTAEGCIARYTGISMPAVVARIEEEWGRSLNADFVDRLRDRDAAVFRSELQPIEGARETLAALTSPRCVASSGRLVKMRLTLSITGLLPFVDPHLFSAEMVARGKPAPDLFLYAAECMGFAPQRCIVIEDSPPGVQAAVAAGMCVLGFVGGAHCPPGHEATLRNAGAACVFSRMAELPRLLYGETSPGGNARHSAATGSISG